MHTLHSLYSYIYILIVIGTFLVVSLSLFLLVSCSMAPKRKSTLSRNPLRSGASTSSDPTPSHVQFCDVMRRPNRTSLITFLNEAFIRNAKSFCRTSLTLTYPLSFTVGVRSHCVMSWSLVHLCLYKSSTPICMDLIIQYLSLSLAFKVCALWSLRILYPRCSMSRG